MEDKSASIQAAAAFAAADNAAHSVPFRRFPLLRCVCLFSRRLSFAVRADGLTAAVAVRWPLCQERRYSLDVSIKQLSSSPSAVVDRSLLYIIYVTQSNER